MKVETTRKHTPIEKITRPFQRFLHVEASGGIVLLICTVLALSIANSPFSQWFSSIWKIPVAISLGDNSLSHSIGHWINDGLMTIFFFVVGLEIKREIVAGELQDKRAAILPAMAALGGMIIPALVYFFVIGDRPGQNGWGIPMATDIAFVVGFLSLFGNRVPHGLKIFLLSLAIVDDLGAILIIAAVYSSNISFGALAFGVLGLGITMLLNKIGVRRVPIYVVVGAGVWLAFLFSGIHPTISGVLLGLLTPSSAWVGEATFFEALSSLRDKWNQQGGHIDAATRSNSVSHLIVSARETVSPLERLQHNLHPWVAFIIMPLFALANAGVPIIVDAITSPVSTAVTLGLVVGKPLGILLFSWFAVKFVGAKLPERVSWGSVTGAGCLAGVGFTMSIFIAGLALTDEHLVSGKTGTLIGSFLSAVIGLAILHFVLPKKAEAAENGQS